MMVLLVKQVHLQKDVAAAREGFGQRIETTAKMSMVADVQAANVNWMREIKAMTSNTSLAVRDIMWFLSCEC
jgi:hypothetical protein